MTALGQGVILVALTASAGSTATAERVYQGTWKTTDRPMDGSITGVIRSVSKDKWAGRFFGSWQGVDFEYKAEFQGPATDLRGTTTVDGVPYQWRGRIDAKGFRANFVGGHRGSFELREVPPEKQSARQLQPNRASR